MTDVKDKWLENLIETAKSFIRQGQQALPTLFLKRKGEIDIVSLEGLPNKDFWSSLVRFLITKMKPDEYALISESWIKKFDPKKVDDRLQIELTGMGLKQVRDYDDRRECLIVVHGTAKGERIGIITFERKGTKVNFSEIDWVSEAITGRLTNLWNPFGGESKTN